MKTTNSIRLTFAALPLLALAACGTTSRPAPAAPGYVAMARPTTDIPARDARPVPGAPAAIPGDVLADPAQRFALMERLRTQVVAETRQVPPARWQGELRPALRLQLERAGLGRSDVDFLLWEIDQAKSARE